MNALTVQNEGNNIQISLNRSCYDSEYIAKLIGRLELDAMAKAAEFSPEVIEIANKIDTDWWKQNGDEFLKNIKK